MKVNQTSELAYYEKAFKYNKKRRELRYGGWDYVPSSSVTSIIRSNRLDEDSKSLRALDVGCGDGRHISLLRSFGFSVVGVDFTANSIKLCRHRFKKDSKVNLIRVDLTFKDSLRKLGQFDFVNDWSVMDHIRGKYLKTYIKNLSNAVKPGGHLILTEFDLSIPGLYKGRKFKIKNGHYFRAFDIGELASQFPNFELIDSREKVLEDKINNYRFNTVLLKQKSAHDGCLQKGNTAR